MKKQAFVRALALLLALLLVTVAVASCTEDPSTPGDDPTPGEPGTETPGEDPEESKYADDLPPLDMGAIELTVAYFNQGTIKEGLSIEAEQSGETIEALMYDRNKFIEERFNVTIKGTELENPIGTGITTPASPVLMAGTPDYDVLVGYQYYDIALAAQGYLYNVNDMENNYLNIENPWWSTDYIRNINYRDQIYWLTGDITLMHIATMTAAYVHSVPYLDYIEPEYGNIYEVVRDMNWTMATLAEMNEMLYVDLNANDAIDAGDQFGFQNSLGIETAYCAGINSSIREEDGAFSVAIDSDRTVDIMWYLDQLSNSEYTFETSDPVERLVRFASAEIMCFFATLLDAETEHLRNMEEDFYILPIPMGDDACDDYRSTCTTATTILGISYCSDYPEETAAVLEALAAQSSVSVTPYYYDTVLKDRYTRDDDSKEMIDLIRNNVAVDFVNTWSLGYTESYVFYMSFDSSTVASRIASHAPKWEKILEELMETLDSLS